MTVSLRIKTILMLNQFHHNIVSLMSS